MQTRTDIHMGSLLNSGGKLAPKKAPKKEKKDLDDEEVAYQAKQRAGMSYDC